jgi:hypothetical protein
MLRIRPFSTQTAPLVANHRFMMVARHSHDLYLPEDETRMAIESRTTVEGLRKCWRLVPRLRGGSIENACVSARALSHVRMN